MPWCKYFIPKIATPGISPNDPNLNEHIMYAKCVKGHVVRDASDWILCENLPAPDALCWQEGGETLLTQNIQVSTRDISDVTGSRPQPARS